MLFCSMFDYLKSVWLLYPKLYNSFISMKKSLWFTKFWNTNHIMSCIFQLSWKQLTWWVIIYPKRSHVRYRMKLCRLLYNYGLQMKSFPITGLLSYCHHRHPFLPCLAPGIGERHWGTNTFIDLVKSILVCLKVSRINIRTMAQQPEIITFFFIILFSDARSLVWCYTRPYCHLCSRPQYLWRHLLK